MRFRKSQVALEFLMTYGWAILVVLAAIGALAYFGILSPEKFLTTDEFGIPKDVSDRADFVCDNVAVWYYPENMASYEIYPMLKVMGESLKNANNATYYEFDDFNYDARPYGGIGVGCLDEEDLEDDLCDTDEQEIISMGCIVPTRLCYEEIEGDGDYCFLMELFVPIKKYSKWEEWYKSLNIK